MGAVRGAPSGHDPNQVEHLNCVDRSQHQHSDRDWLKHGYRDVADLLPVRSAVQLCRLVNLDRYRSHSRVQKNEIKRKTDPDIGDDCRDERELRISQPGQIRQTEQMPDLVDWANFIEQAFECIGGGKNRSQPGNQ